jgi:AcrR family transcriptional regulator
MYTMSTSKSAYHHGDLRAALITSALTRLGGAGGDISLRELARDLGVSAMAAYRHFASKEALLAAVADEGFKQLDAETHARTGSPSEQLFLDLTAYVAFARANPALYSLMFGTLHADGPALPNRSLSFAGLKQKVAAVTGLKVDDPQTDVSAARIWAAVHGCASLVISGLIGKDRTGSGLVEAILKPLCDNPACAKV